jgi:hypothetical protein
VSTYRLGAIELIELGNAVPRIEKPYNFDPGRRPFMSSRYPRTFRGPELGQLDFSNIGSFLAGAFEFIFKMLANLVNVPLDVASQGVGVLFDGVSGLLKNIPALGPICSELLLLAKAVIQWGLKVPGMTLSLVGNVFSEIKNAVDTTKSSGEKKQDESIALKNLLRKAEEKGGSTLESAVSQAISGKIPDGVTGVPPLRPEDLPPGADTIGAPSSVDRILGIGLPVAAVLVLALS